MPHLDLVQALRALARAEHDDLSVADAAADEIERLRAECELWQDRCAAERRDHEASIKEFDRVYNDIGHSL